MKHLELAGADEIICASDFEYGIIAQCAVFGKMSTVYNQLLNYSEDTVEFYVLKPEEIPSHLFGKTFMEISEYFLKNRAIDPVILVGIIGDKDVKINPYTIGPIKPKLQIDKLNESDSLIVIAYDFPELEKFE